MFVWWREHKEARGEGGEEGQWFDLQKYGSTTPHNRTHALPNCLNLVPCVQAVHCKQFQVSSLLTAAVVCLTYYYRKATKE